MDLGYAGTKVPLLRQGSEESGRVNNETKAGLLFPREETHQSSTIRIRVLLEILVHVPVPRPRADKARVAVDQGITQKFDDSRMVS